MKRLMTIREMTKFNYEDEKHLNELAEIVVSFLADYDTKKLTKRHIDKLKEHLTSCYHDNICVYVDDRYSLTYLVVRVSDLELKHLKIGNGEKCPIIDIERIEYDNQWCLSAAKERNEIREYVLSNNAYHLSEVEDTINEIKELQKKLEKQTKDLPEGLLFQELTERFPKIAEKYYIEKSV